VDAFGEDLPRGALLAELAQPGLGLSELAEDVAGDDGEPSVIHAPTRRSSSWWKPVEVALLLEDVADEGGCVAELQSAGTGRCAGTGTPPATRPSIAQAAYAIAQADPPSARWAVFNYAFTLLWCGDLDEATTVLRESLRPAEQCGDTALRSRSLTYLMAAARKRGDVEAVRTAIDPVIEQARATSLPEYEAMAIANRAWVA
jgi:hypothetical protein